jgi:antitoxin (DNA-binding transcriptional repressor) of toxin-antitoxin stability system
VKATVAELHRDTDKLVKPIVNGRKVLVLTEKGEPRAMLVPLPAKADRKKALAILRSMRGLRLPPRR